MKLHIFNAEHDMALAYDVAHFTLPHAIQEFKTNLGFLPALWADDGDFVLVDDVMFALKALSQLRARHADVLFVTASDLKNFVFSKVEPWGWDKALCKFLTKAGVDAAILPAPDYLEMLRNLSDRRRTTDMLIRLRQGIESATCGESLCCTALPEILDALRKHGKIVVKAPWSSSGRGVRYIDGGIMATTAKWIANTAKRQGCVMVEPYYKKVCDFAMEFYSHGDGRVDYCGLSLFLTNGSSYSGNAVATEAEKERAISRYIRPELMGEVRQRAMQYLSESGFRAYKGPLGIDMMAVTNDGGDGFLLDPCVEINLRRTMGHVANALKPTDAEPARLMRIVHEVNYKLKFETLENCFVKVY